MALMQNSSNLKLDIVLEDSLGIYEPGDKISGYVSLTSEQDVPAAGVYLWILGQAEVEWPDKKSGQATLNTDYEIYMKECMVLWSKEQNQLCETRPVDGVRAASGDEAPRGLKAGEHVFRFEYELPDSLPSSFRTQGLIEEEGAKGQVYYLLRVKIDSAEDTLRRSHKDLNFIVLRNLDLNLVQDDMLRAVALHSENVQCSWCYCSSGSISCSVKLDRTGFVPGEDISVDVQLENLSYKDVCTSIVSMKQIIVMHTSCSSQKCFCDIFSLTGGKVKAGDNAFYHDIIHIPPLPPSGLMGCSIIDVEYVIEASVYLSSSSKAALEMSVPITIGTIPVINASLTGLYVTSNFQRYSHSRGSIEGYTSDCLQQGRCHNVYRYYKCHYKMADGVKDTASNGDIPRKVSRTVTPTAQRLPNYLDLSSNSIERSASNHIASNMKTL